MIEKDSKLFTKYQHFFKSNICTNLMLLIKTILKDYTQCTFKGHQKEELRKALSANSPNRLESFYFQYKSTQ